MISFEWLFFLLSVHLAEDGERKEINSEREKYQELSGLWQLFFFLILFLFDLSFCALILSVNIFLTESPMEEK